MSETSTHDPVGDDAGPWPPVPGAGRGGPSELRADAWPWPLLLGAGQLDSNAPRVFLADRATPSCRSEMSTRAPLVRAASELARSASKDSSATSKFAHAWARAGADAVHDMRLSGAPEPAFIENSHARQNTRAADSVGATKCRPSCKADSFHSRRLRARLRAAASSRPRFQLRCP